MNFMVRYSNGKRTAEMAFSASPTEAERTVALVRAKFRDRFNIEVEYPRHGTCLLALTNRRWRPVPNYLKYELPAYVVGVLSGLRDVVQSKLKV